MKYSFVVAFKTLVVWINSVKNKTYGFLFIKLLWFGDKDKTIFVKIKQVQQIVLLL